MSSSNLWPWAPVLVGVVLIVWVAIAGRVLPEYERAVIFRLGNVLRKPKGPGLVLLLPFGIDRMRKVNLRTVTMNIPPQDIITSDNVTLRVDAVVYSRVVDPVKAVVEIQNYLFATSQAAQTNLRAILGSPPSPTSRRISWLRSSRGNARCSWGRARPRMPAGRRGGRSSRSCSTVWSAKTLPGGPFASLAGIPSSSRSWCPDAWTARS